MLEEIKNYWNDRSQSYSQENMEELSSEKRRIWERVFYKYISSDLRGLKILDVGCGPGIFSLLLSQLGAEVIGLDYTPKMIEKAKENASKYDVKVDFIQGDAQNLIFEDGSFDIVVSRNLTWNLGNPKRAYEEWWRVLKKAGSFSILMRIGICNSMMRNKIKSIKKTGKK